MAQDEPGVVDALKAVGGFAKRIYSGPDTVAKAIQESAPAGNEAQVAAREARAAGKSALDDAIKRGMAENNVPSGAVAPIPGTRLGE
jgi:hypothetical protein